MQMQLTMLDTVPVSVDSSSSGRTSPGSNTPPTTPSAVCWQDLSAQIIPCGRHLNADGGLTSVWLPGQGHGLHGGFSMLNISAWPNDGSACFLSSVLKTAPIPPRYYL